MYITSDLALFSNMLGFSPSDFNFLMKHCLQAPFKPTSSSPLAPGSPFMSF